MKYKSCQWVTRGIEFRMDAVRLCCYGYLQGKNSEYQTTLIPNYHGQKIDWNKIFEIKEKLKNDHKNNIYMDSCKNCLYLQENDWDEENYINHFTFNHFTKCNCNCIYCYTNTDKKAFNSYKEYKIYPIIKDMFKQGIIKKMEESCIIFGGGEPTILKDFDKMINLFIKKGSKNIRINSSGIKYSKSIENGLKQGVISLVISTDAGSESTYEKIKQVKCYKKVWENIRKYVKAQKNDNLLKVKFILYPGVNDTYEEINGWFEKIIENGVKAVCFSVEQDWYQQALSTNNFPPKIYEQMSYMENRAKELNLDLEIYCEALAVLNSKDNKNV